MMESSLWGQFLILRSNRRVFYVKLHNILLEIGVNRFVNFSKWMAFTISLVLTIGHVVEYMFFKSPSTMVYYSFFINQRSVKLIKRGKQCDILWKEGLNRNANQMSTPKWEIVGLEEY